MKQGRHLLPVLAIAFGLCLVASAKAQDRQDYEFFEKKIRPVLVRHCYECHSAAATEVKGKLRLDSRAAIRKGGETGPAVVPGKVKASLLISALRHDSIEMPPDKKLPDKVIADFEKWIADGAPDPRDRPPSSDEVAELTWQSVLEQRRNWWSLQPVKPPKNPKVRNTSWSTHPIDRFILRKLESKNLAPSPDASLLVLLRRLSLILTGLPPTPADIEKYQMELSNQKKETVYVHWMNQLLDSPHFGERWARHWMDVVRYAETHGYEWNHEIRDAWQYRDYLIRAFNKDVPYDQLVREHIAGDLLARPRINQKMNINESVIGTAFWRFSELGHDNCVKFPEIRFDALDNQIDTFSKAFQATTLSCARCHDHKLDPISTRDYYAMVGVLESSRQVVQTIDTPQRIEAETRELQSIKNELRSRIATAWLSQIEELDTKIVTALQAASDQQAASASSLAKTLSKPKADIAVEDPSSVLHRFVGKKPADIAATWQNVAAGYREQAAQNDKFNSDHFKSWFDVEKWKSLGLAIGEQVSPAGEFVVDVNGNGAVRAILPSGMYSHLLSSRLNGTLQSEWMPGDRKYVSIQFVGGGLSMIRSVTDSCSLNEYVGGGLSYLSTDALQWRKYPTRVDSAHRAFLELTTKSDNLRWPDRPGVAGNDKAQLESPRSWFGVIQAYTHDCDESPRPELGHFMSLFEGTVPTTIATIGKSYVRVCQSALNRWKFGKATNADVRWINWMLTSGLLSNSKNLTADIQRLIVDYRKVEDNLAAPRVVAGMADHGDGFDSPVLERGNPLSLGDTEPRRYLEVLTGSRSPMRKQGSGRRELAHIVASANNPLTARVMVNRVWHHLFGIGLVRTTDDFGHLGDKPSHPELLDYLASWFVDNEWSVKKLIRHIVTSRTFQQSSTSSQAGRDADPENRLLHHFPVRRLDAESIRDSILALSGRLDRTVFGPSIQPFRAEPKAHRKLYGGPLDGDGRRSIYLKITRMEGPRFLELFDFPDPTATRGRRDSTNVPAQALAMLNDPFVIDQARIWSEKLVKQKDSTVGKRIDRVFVTALARSPSEAERLRLANYVDRLATLHKVAPDTILKNQMIWQDVAHAMFNMKELVYIR